MESLAIAGEKLVRTRPVPPEEIKYKEEINMSPEEFANCRVVAEIYRRQRRENERLKKALGIRTEADRKFSEEDEAVFALVRMNRERLS